MTSSLMAKMAYGIKIIYNDIIKPSSPTPNHLRTFKLSLLDQLTLHSYSPILLLYKSTISKSSDVLRKSLSETLTKYYPFAGRLQEDGITVDCGDQGVVFVEAKVSGCRLSEFLRYPRLETQRLLYPQGFFWKESCIGHSFLATQATYFEGGGMAVTVSLSHKVADGTTVANFISEWAAAARGEVTSPPMMLATSIPCLELGYTIPEIVIRRTDTCVNRRFVFDAQKIAKLRQAVVGVVENPTRIELITALLYRSAIAASIAKTGGFRNSNLIQLVNMRRRMATPLPRNSVGNFSWYFTTSIDHEGQIMNLGELVQQLKKGIKELRDGGDNRSLGDWLLSVRKSANDAKELFDDVDVYRCSDVHSAPFYETDFGWGTPRWVTISDMLVQNVFILFNTPDGDGIEAVVSLEEEHMKLFESNQELLQFASTSTYAI